MDYNYFKMFSWKVFSRSWPLKLQVFIVFFTDYADFAQNTSEKNLFKKANVIKKHFSEHTVSKKTERSDAPEGVVI